MRRSRFSTLAHVILPTERLLDCFPEEILELDNYGITAKDLVRVTLDFWADYNHHTPMDRFASSSMRLANYRYMDDLCALQVAIESDLVDSSMTDYATQDELMRITDIVTRACVTTYLFLDKHLKDLFVFGEQGEIDLCRWLGHDIVVRYRK